MRRPVTWLDVFTATPLTGNQLAVVHEVDGVDDATMFAFARETRLSETTYVQTATADVADYRNRIWTMAGALPFAGHPSLGTAVASAAGPMRSPCTRVSRWAAPSRTDCAWEGDRPRVSGDVVVVAVADGHLLPGG